MEWNWDGLAPDSQIYPSVLQQAGYRTIHIGKAHFGRGESIDENPLSLGFDVNIAGSAIGHPGSYYGQNGYGWIHGQRTRAVQDLEKYHGTDTFLTDALTLEAIAQIEQCVASGTPFYLNMTHYAVHSPFEANPQYLGQYADGKDIIPGAPSKVGSYESRAFATLIESMDKSLGDLMDTLEELGVAENTLIIFLGDNGGDAPLLLKARKETHTKEVPVFLSLQHGVNRIILFTLKYFNETRGIVQFLLYLNISARYKDFS